MSSVSSYRLQRVSPRSPIGLSISGRATYGWARDVPLLACRCSDFLPFRAGIDAPISSTDGRGETEAEKMAETRPGSVAMRKRGSKTNRCTGATGNTMPPRPEESKRGMIMDEQAGNKDDRTPPSLLEPVRLRRFERGATRGSEGGNLSSLALWRWIWRRSRSTCKTSEPVAFLSPFDRSGNGLRRCARSLASKRPGVGASRPRRLWAAASLAR